MGRPGLCNCLCEVPGPPDCFGCTDPGNMFPSVWQVDLPSSMSVPSLVTCGPITQTVSGIPGTLDRRYTLECEVEWPSIQSTSLLIVDDRPIDNYSFSWVTCVWLSNDYQMYDRMYWNGIPWSNAFCSHAGHYPGVRKYPDWTAPTPWYYYELPTVTVSPNRSRVNAATDHPHAGSCSTEVDPALPDPSSPRYTCDFIPYGAQWYLSVETVGATKKLVAILKYWMRFGMTYLIEDYLLGGPFYPATGWRPASPSPGFASYFTAPAQVLSIVGTFAAWPTVSGNDCKSTLFPSYGSNVNLHTGPNLVRYEKVIDCATDFDGTPVVLTKAEDYKANTTSTKTIIDAMGIGSSPSYITLTPVI